MYPATADALINRALMTETQSLNRKRTLNDDVVQIEEECFFKRPDCDDKTIFRTITGQCNNLRHPFWGASNTVFRRLAEAKYADGHGEPFGREPREAAKPPANQFNIPGLPNFGGVSNPFKGWPFGPSKDPCKSTEKKQLPSTRDVSRSFHDDRNIPDKKRSLLVMQFGQFLDHDLTLTPETHEEECCEKGHMNLGNCFAIEVARNDPFLRAGGHREACLEFTRSTAFCPRKSDVREQLNGVSSFVDASQVYDATDSHAKDLRTGEHGKMKVSQEMNSADLLPRMGPGNDFTAGDERALEMPGLITLHTLFVREHNRIAKEMKLINPKASDELLYQSARRVVIGEMQNIVYGDYLETIMGVHLASRFGLNIRRGRSVYNPFKDPGTSNAFATAAFRFGHSQIQGTTDKRDPKTGKITDVYKLRDGFFSEALYLGSEGRGMEEILLGQAKQPSQANDRFITLEVTEFLIPGPGAPFSDLVARNLQRGRDHGLPGYNEYRKFCNLPPACTWDRPPREIPFQTWKRLQSLYDHPNDIELFTGGLAESPVFGGAVGPTFGCILGAQFKAVKDGDRFFFTHKGQAGSFNDEQLENLRERTLADVNCDNTDIKLTNANVFLLGSPARPCLNRNPLKTKLFFH